MKFATGGVFVGADTDTVLDTVVDAPALSVTRKLTKYEPDVGYVYDGFFTTDVTPLPKFHNQPTIEPSASVLRSLNEHDKPVQLCVKFAIGGVFAGVLVPSVCCKL